MMDRVPSWNISSREPSMPGASSRTTTADAYTGAPGATLKRLSSDTFVGRLGRHRPECPLVFTVTTAVVGDRLGVTGLPEMLEFSGYVIAQAEESGGSG